MYTEFNRITYASSIPGVSYRIASPEDAPALLNIYGPYVTNTAITFEYEVPSEAEFATRISRTLEHFPYLVVLIDNKICGYAYVSPFHARAAYSWCVELSIYLSFECHGMGIGRELYGIIEDIMRKQNILNLYACIACTETEDEHLTNASTHFHEHLGFKLCGHFKHCGYKFGKWYDMVWMEKTIGEHVTDTPPVIPFHETL